VKKLALTLGAVAGLVSLGYIGLERYSGKDYSGNDKERIQPAPPYSPPDQKPDIEAASTLSAQPGDRDLDFDWDEVNEQFDITQSRVFLDNPIGDYFPTRGDAWSGGAEEEKTTLTVAAVTGVVSLGYTSRERYSGKDKEVIEPASTPREWYRAHEWNFDIWAAYAFSDQPGQRDLDFDLDAVDDQFDRTEMPVFLGEPVRDRFLNRDNAWGAGGDLKYFWSRYFGAGVEGFVLDARDTGGAALATLTVRYPIGSSRFAPYGFAGFGILAGGSHTERFFAEHHVAFGVEVGETEFFERKVVQNKHARVIGQFGGGLEFRITRPSTMSKIALGLMADFTWNLVGGQDSDDQDFGMTRLGLNFSY
jgi:hypothetical protein